MAEATAVAKAGEAKVEAAPLAPASAERKAQVKTLLDDIFRLMEYPAALDFKDMPDGGIGVAVHFEGELPGITPGKRSYLVDCIQFLVNKALNRPNVERRWVTLGINAFPEPRGPRDRPADAPPRPSAPPAEQKRGPEAKKADKPAEAKKADRPPEAKKDGKKGERGKKGHEARGDAGEVDEHTLEVAEDPALTALAKELVEKAQRLGRPYALLMLSAEDRARVLKAAKGAEGVTVKAEGKKHLRRVSFLPHKLTPMPRRHFMADDDEEE